ncbi:DUF3857 domain-containing protein [Phenylobacterium sp. LjRoot219]|uniref:DUF3857 domain-containing protein n=1 Tax=Phenylobacterium sp. LjRoot219 TaxID=3342283 RepID=UPI003ED05ECD
MILLVLGVASVARAEDSVPIAPPPAWVIPVEPPPRSARPAGFEVRLLDYQTRLDETGVHQFGHQIYRLSSLAALQNAGTVAVTWQPAYGQATVNRLVIRRGDERIDVLKTGAAFKVIQREAGLEALQVNGLLTAVLQVPDLRIGDELEFSFTIDRRNPALGERQDAEDFISGSTVDRLFVRYSWPEGRKVNWRVGDRLPPAKREAKDGAAAIVISGDNVKPPAIIPGAPMRYLDGGAVAVSEYGSWREVAEAAAPLFETAAQITADSPLHGEIRKIAAASPDAKVRTELALQLVQTQVRYFARLDGLGGYVPQSADMVWRTRSGDCKGKTVLLLALLRGLGVEAEPALLSTVRGDGLEAALPGVVRFNHVLVRATVQGQTYWLDGSRPGDRSLERLDPPPFKWALPLGPHQRALEALPPAPPQVALNEWRLDLDARAGLGRPAKAQGLVVLRGDEAMTFRTAASLLSRDERDQGITKLWQDRHDWVTVDHVTYEDDEATGEVRLGFTGSGVMDWDTQGPEAANRYEANKARLGVDLAPSRDADVAKLAPVAVGARYETVHQTILLPAGGQGFTLQSEPVDETIGGVRYTRTASLRGERFDMTATTRSAQGELSFAEAHAADRKTDALFDKGVFIALPPTMVAGRPVSGVTPTDAAAIQAVLKLTQDGKFEQALAALEKQQWPGDLKAHAAALRGSVLAQLGRNPDAMTAFDEALALDRTHRLALAGKATLLLMQNRPDDALILADRLVLVAPEEGTVYRLRGSAREQVRDYKGALADWDIAIEKQVGGEALHIDRLNVLYALGERDKALSDAGAVAARFPQSALTHAAHASMLARAGRRDEAAKAAALSLKLEPNADAYLIRVHYGLSGDDQATLQDLLAMIRLQPTRKIPEEDVVRVIALPGARKQLEAAYDDAKPASPAEAGAIALGRSIVAAAAGEPDGLLARYDAEVTKQPKDPNPLNNACWARATWGVQLDRALTDCSAAIALDPKAGFLDSRGLVRLRLEAYADAIADYDAALSKDADMPTSLFGRGLAKLRTGNKAGGDSDLAAARQLDARIDRQFANMGIQP